MKLYLKASILILSTFLANFLFTSADIPSISNQRVQWTMDETYKGSFENTYSKLRYRIPGLMRQTLIDLSVRLGMNFEEDWQYPLTIRFADGSARGVENALAYVLLQGDGSHFEQSLNINVEAYEREQFDFDRVFAHELVHAMLNDAVGGQAAVLFPHWLHEGLAVYGADQGDRMARAYVLQLKEQAEVRLVGDLNNFNSGLDYAQAYWAVKYIREVHGFNSLHYFVRELIRNRGDVPQALEKGCSETWDAFQENVKKYSREEIAGIQKFKPLRYEKENPY